MTTDQFRLLQRARPFQPFAIHLADGRYLTVRHPEVAVLSGSGRTLQILNPDRLMEVVDVLLVISLRPLNETELSTRR